MKETKSIAQSRDWYVAKGNDLIQKSRYSLTVQQQRVLLYMISRIRPGDQFGTLYEISYPDFCKVAGLKYDEGGIYHSTIKAIILKLMQVECFVEVMDEQGMVHEKPFLWLDPNVVDLSKSRNSAIIGFSKIIQPYLFQLKNRYTQYHLSEVLPFRSKYSIRLYQILQSRAFGRDFENGHEVEVELATETLKHMLDVQNYRITMLKQRVLIPAVTEINQFSEQLHVEMLENKIGQRVVGISFMIKQPSARQLLDAKTAKDERRKGKSQPQDVQD